MVRFIVGLMLVSMAEAQQRKAAPIEAKPVSKAAQPRAVVRQPETKIPAGAKQIEPNLFRYTDPQGKVWIYKESPFGLMKHEETAAERAERAAAPVATDDGLKAVEDGETIRFSRETPFGESRWTRKKTDKLEDAERAAWERARKSKE